MLVYWLLLGFFVLGALTERSPGMSILGPRPMMGGAPNVSSRISYPPMLIVGALLTVIVIGFRYRVGADWDSYTDMFLAVRRLSFETAVSHGDPAYQTINWMVGTNGYRIWLVNLVSAAIFCWGLLRFCATQPRPWLAFAVAVPYLVIVVAMGYTRQAVALGVLMAGLANQVKGASAMNFAIYVGVAALFHSTAIVLFPIIAWSARGNALVNIALTVSIGITFYQYFLGDTMDRLVTNYIETSYSSQGALIRVSMNLVAAICFFVIGKKLDFTEHEYKIWRNLSVVACLMLVLLFVLSSSTAVDRVSLYLIPLQLAVLARLPKMTDKSSGTVIGVIVYSILVQFVWLNFGQWSRFWVPYHFFPL